MLLALNILANILPVTVKLPLTNIPFDTRLFTV